MGLWIQVLEYYYDKEMWLVLRKLTVGSIEMSEMVYIDPKLL